MYTANNMLHESRIKALEHIFCKFTAIKFTLLFTPMKNPKPQQLALFATAGALAPEILFLYANRLNTHFQFAKVLEPGYFVPLLLYVALAAFVAAFLPYKQIPPAKFDARWKAFVVGLLLPLVIHTATNWGSNLLAATH